MKKENQYFTDEVNPKIKFMIPNNESWMKYEREVVHVPVIKYIETLIRIVEAGDVSCRKF